MIESAGCRRPLAFSGGQEGAIDGIAALLPLVERRGACRHPDGVVQLVRSMLAAFPADAHWHLCEVGEPLFPAPEPYIAACAGTTRRRWTLLCSCDRTNRGSSRDR